MTASAAVFAYDGVKTGVSLSRTKAFVGDIVEAVVSAELPEKAYISANRQASFKNFDIINSEIRHVSFSPNVYEFKYSLAAYGTGTFAIEPAAITYSDADGTEKIFFTPSAQIEIESSLTDGGNDIKDIKPLKKLKVKAAYVIAGIIVFLLIVVLIINTVREIKNKPHKNIIFDPKTEALKALDLLYNERNEIESRLLYYKMSEILRTYIAKVRSVNTMEMTASEFMSALKTMLAPAADESSLRNYMKIFNLARYARLKPSDEETEKNFKLTGELLEKL